MCTQNELGRKTDGATVGLSPNQANISPLWRATRDNTDIQAKGSTRRVLCRYTDIREIVLCMVK